MNSWERSVFGAYATLFISITNSFFQIPTIISASEFIQGALLFNSCLMVNIQNGKRWIQDSAILSRFEKVTELFPRIAMIVVGSLYNNLRVQIFGFIPHGCHVHADCTHAQSHP